MFRTATPPVSTARRLRAALPPDRTEFSARPMAELPDESTTDRSPRLASVGPAPLAYASVKSNVKWGTDAARMVVIGNSSFALDGSIEVQANRDFYLNCALWLSGDEATEAIVAKTINSGSLIIRGNEFTGLALLCVAVLPGLAFLAGFVVWVRRRNR